MSRVDLTHMDKVNQFEPMLICSILVKARLYLKRKTLVTYHHELFHTGTFIMSIMIKQNYLYRQ